MMGQSGKFGGIINAFDIKPGGGNARVIQQRGCDICEAGLRLIADTGDIANRQTARLHAKIDRNI